jgi:hypothetical protein
VSVFPSLDLTDLEASQLGSLRIKWVYAFWAGRQQDEHELHTVGSEQVAGKHPVRHASGSIPGKAHFIPDVKLV